MIANEMRQQYEALMPADFCRLLLKALNASEGRSKRRKRDQTPDQIGMTIKRGLLAGVAAANPPPEEFGAWLLGRALSEPAIGPVHAMCCSILDDYRLAVGDPAFRAWLEAGAPSDDASQEEPKPIELTRKKAPRDE